jgi:hypothetical protein
LKGSAEEIFVILCCFFQKIISKGVKARQNSAEQNGKKQMNLESSCFRESDESDGGQAIPPQAMPERNG